MRNSTKRLISSILALLMIVSMIPVYSLAEGETQPGEQAQLTPMQQLEDLIAQAKSLYEQNNTEALNALLNQMNEFINSNAELKEVLRTKAYDELKDITELFNPPQENEALFTSFAMERSDDEGEPQQPSEDEQPQEENKEESPVTEQPKDEIPADNNETVIDEKNNENTEGQEKSGETVVDSNVNQNENQQENNTENNQLSSEDKKEEAVTPGEEEKKEEPTEENKEEATEENKEEATPDEENKEPAEEQSKEEVDQSFVDPIAAMIDEANACWDAEDFKGFCEKMDAIFAYINNSNVNGKTKSAATMALIEGVDSGRIEAYRSETNPFEEKVDEAFIATIKALVDEANALWAAEDFEGFCAKIYEITSTIENSNANDATLNAANDYVDNNISEDAYAAYWEGANLFANGDFKLYHYGNFMKNCSTLDEALIGPGDTIEILVDGTYTGAFSQAFSGFTIKVASGKNYTFDFSSQTGSFGTLNNVTFQGSNKNIKFKMPATADYVGFQNSSGLNFKDCDFQGKFFSYGSMSFENCDFYNPSDYSMWCYAGDVTYKNCSFKSDAGKFLNIYNEGNTTTPWNITVDNCSFTNTGNAAKAALNVKETVDPNASSIVALKYNVNVTNCTTNGSFPTSASSTSTLTVINELVQVDSRSSAITSEITVTVDGAKKYPAAVAKIGNTEYSTLGDAINAAKSGETIELLKNIALDADVETKCDVTIDTGTYTLTSSSSKTLKVNDGSTITLKGAVSGDLYIEDSVDQKNSTQTGYTANLDSGSFDLYAAYINGGSTLTVNFSASASATYWNVYGGTLNILGTSDVRPGSGGTVYNVTGDVNLNDTANASIISVYSPLSGKNAGLVNIFGTTNVYNSVNIGVAATSANKYGTNDNGSRTNATVNVTGTLNLPGRDGSTFTSTIQSGGILNIADGGSFNVGETGKWRMLYFNIEQGGTLKVGNAQVKFAVPSVNAPNYVGFGKLNNSGTIELNPGSNYCFEITDIDNQGEIKADLTNCKAGDVIIKYVGSGTPNYGKYEVTGGNFGLEVDSNNNLVVAEPVATVNGKSYSNLANALQDAVKLTGNVTVEILTDIDLKNAAWPEITVDGSKVALETVTVNGNGKTIKGLTGPLFAGTWAGKSGLVINNLTISDSAIVKDQNDSVGTVGVGAFIGYPQASAVITLNGCTLTNSSVEGGHWTGGLIGIAGGHSTVRMALTITGCSVTDSTIKGAGSVGGVIGHAINDANTEAAINGTTITGNTIISTGSSTNKAGAVMGTVGAAETTLNAAVSGNKVTSGTNAENCIFGRFGTSNGILSITGGSYDAVNIIPDDFPGGNSFKISNGAFTGAKPFGDPAATVFNGLEISGGTFNQEVPTGEVPNGPCAVGYIPYDNKDGTYTVLYGKTPMAVDFLYNYNTNTDFDPTPNSFTQYPTGMNCYPIFADGTVDTSSPIPELTNLLTYKGTSVKITNGLGIRIITEMDKAQRDNLIQNGFKLGGKTYKLDEAGTMAMMWSEYNTNGNVFDMTAKIASSTFYKSSGQDAVFEDKGSAIWCTNNLTGYRDDQLPKGVLLRPYAKFVDDTGAVLYVYGGIINRSISYVANANISKFSPDSEEYKLLTSMVETSHEYPTDAD